MRIWNLDDNENVDIQIFLPPLPGNVILDVGSKASPVAVSGVGSIAAPIYPRQRSWLVSTGGPVTPLLPASGIGVGVQEWWLACTSNSNTINLDTTVGLILAGPFTGANGSVLYLQADGAGGWIEGGRNEI